MRDYYKMERPGYADGFGSHLTQTIKRLLIAHLLIFVLQLLVGGGFVKAFGLIPYMVTHNAAIWQPLTAIFLHGGLWNLLLTGIVLWFFAPEVEMALGGGARFMRFYMTCGALANVFAVILAPNAQYPIVGPGGAIFAVLAGFATLFPNRVLTLLLFFVLPVQIKAKYLVLIFGIVEWLSLAQGRFGDFARYANLAGIGLGWFMIRRSLRRDPYGKPSFFSRLAFWGRGGEKYDDAYIRRRIDPILEKIAKKGMQSLTWREKRILRKGKGRLKPR